MGESDYSFSLTTFSQSGKLIQLEYAVNAVASGGTSVGIKASNGVVLATEKKLPSTLIVNNTVKKVCNVDEHIGVVYSGMGADYRVLLTKARKKAVSYKLKYGVKIPVSRLVAELGSIMQEYTQSGGVRPFGVSLLVAGYDEKGTHLYQVDPSGSNWAWKASAIGRKMQSARTLLEKRYDPELEIDDAVHIAILTLKEGYEGKLDENVIEIGCIREDGEFRLLTKSEVRDSIELS